MPLWRKPAASGCVVLALLVLAALEPGAWAADAPPEEPARPAAAGETEKPPAAPTGVLSMMLGGRPTPKGLGELPGEFSEAALVRAMARTVTAGENGEEKTRKILDLVGETYREMAEDKAFAALPCALLQPLSGRAGRPCHYFLYVPEGYEAKRDYPMLLLLHGGGGNLRLGFYLAVRYARKHGFIVACPTFRDGEFWTRAGETFAMRVLKDVRARYRVDAKAVSIAGVSNGAVGAWAISQRHKDAFAAVLSISGAFNGRAAVKSSEGPPLYIVHGARDRVIPAPLSRAAFEALKSREGTVYREFAGEGHLVAFIRHEEVLGGAFEWLTKLFDRRREEKTGESPAPEASAGPEAAPAGAGTPDVAHGQHAEPPRN